MFRYPSKGVPAFLIGLLAVLGPGPALLAHDDKGNGSKKQIEEHRRIDSGFPGFDRLNRQLQYDYSAFDYGTTGAAYRRAMAMAASPDAGAVGQWSPALDIGIVSIHNAVLPNGKILMWDSVGDGPTESYEVHDTTRAVTWDPATGVATRYDVNTGYNLFCAGHAQLPDGRQFIAGGNLNQYLDGLDALHIFDWSTNTWNFKGPMTQGGRWYPSVTALATGEMLITSGGPDTPEIYNTQSGIRPLQGATLHMPLYPWLIAAPNGKTAYFGPANDLRYLDTSGSGSWSAAKGRDGLDRSYGSYASYDLGKILVSGGGGSLRSTVVLDINNGAAKVTQAGDMAIGRRQHNLTVLPNGTVLATGGNSSGASLVDLNGGVFAAELWNPATGVWQTLSSAQKQRQYHSMALLLPDGRVLTGGGGICGDCFRSGYLEKNIEIFSPPYLFMNDGSGQLAPRPGIRSAPASVGYRQTFTVTVDGTRSVSQVVLMRPASVTHSVNFDQRRIPLRVSNNNRRGIQVTSPNDASVAPAGYYMMFVINDAGVPSVAKMVKLG